MSKRLSLGGFACAVFVVAAGCQELPGDVEPDDLDGADAGQTVDPVVVPDPRNATRDAGHVSADAGPPRADASQAKDDGSAPDAGPTGEPDAEVDAEVDSALPTEQDASTPPSLFASMYAQVTLSCVGCHGAGKTLDLSTPELAHAGLVGVTAQYTACAPEGGSPPVRVIAGSPEDSLLMAKLEGTQGCGKQMPPKALLTPEQVEMFRAWIVAGAPAE